MAAADNGGGPDPARETVADWLRLHGLTPDRCRALLDDAPPPPRPETVPDPALGLTAHEVMDIGCTALVRMMPGAAQGPVADQLRLVRVLTDPDRIRKMRGTDRAVTLDQGSAGPPIVLCPYRNRLWDAKALMHEMAHALQYLRSPAFVAPAWRESFAFVGEQALLLGFRPDHSTYADAMAQLWKNESHSFLGPYSTRLHAAIEDETTAYDYDWNYALARATHRYLILNSDTYISDPQLNPAKVLALAAGTHPVPV